MNAGLPIDGICAIPTELFDRRVQLSDTQVRKIIDNEHRSFMQRLNQATANKEDPMTTTENPTADSSIHSSQGPKPPLDVDRLNTELIAKYENVIAQLDLARKDRKELNAKIAGLVAQERYLRPMVRLAQRER